MPRGSLGPFPKTLRLREIAELAGNSDPDTLISRLLQRLSEEAMSQESIDDLGRLLDLVFGTRVGAAYHRLGSVGAPEQSAAEATIREVVSSSEAALLGGGSWGIWREFDGPDFCDLARTYFSNYLRVLLADELGTDPEDARVTRFAHEASLITRSFSARWFNACARFGNPDRGSVRWYFHHCLGKIELELERERSDWIEPSGNPWSRKRPPTPQLGFEF
ncbi:MAG TPA: hypothetical protein VG944_16900 [Fimbriimonas sp.]|nr:hypothetical protein [Fimbriimonas sp.]